MGQVDCDCRHRLLDRPGFGQTRKAMQRFQIVWLFGYTRESVTKSFYHPPIAPMPIALLPSACDASLRACWRAPTCPQATAKA